MLRALRREGCNQKENVYLFNSIVLPNMSYGLAVYGAAEAELTTIQRFWIDVGSVGIYLAQHGYPRSFRKTRYYALELWA